MHIEVNKVKKVKGKSQITGISMICPLEAKNIRHKCIKFAKQSKASHAFNIKNEMYCSQHTSVRIPLLISSTMNRRTNTWLHFYASSLNGCLLSACELYLRF